MRPTVSHRPAPAKVRPAIEEIIRAGAVRAVYQPIVALPDGEPVGYEALARGPQGSALESPLALFAAARDAGLLGELEWACRAAALRGALAAGLPDSVALFLNVEPSLADDPPPAWGTTSSRRPAGACASSSRSPGGRSPSALPTSCAGCSGSGPSAGRSRSTTSAPSRARSR